MAQRKLKDWFDRDCAGRLGEAIKAVYPEFNGERYAEDVVPRLAGRELKARVLVMAEGLRTHLPQDYERAITIMIGALGPELAEETGTFTQGYWLMPVARFVETFGTHHWSVSMKACEEITKRHTAEYAVRPYLEAEPNRTLARFRGWSGSDNPHVRRLASEGARPRLPWAKRLTVFRDDPAPLLELVEPLKSDPSSYVRKSVANLINDISKDHPQAVLDLTNRWSDGADERTNWIIRHGTRTLRSA